MSPAELRKWRKRHQLTQGSLAVRLGTHINTVHRWENGTAAIPAFLSLALETLEARGAAPERQPVQRTGFCSTCTAAVTAGDGHHHRDPWTIVPERQPVQAP